MITLASTTPSIFSRPVSLAPPLTPFEPVVIELLAALPPALALDQHEPFSRFLRGLLLNDQN
jgi:hypothetical protein